LLYTASRWLRRINPVRDPFCESHACGGLTRPNIYRYSRVALSIFPRQAKVPRLQLYAGVEYLPQSLTAENVEDLDMTAKLVSGALTAICLHSGSYNS
jgi:hypothetical protein